MGDSAGGNLSIVVAQQAALQGLSVPKLVVAVYPKTDGANEMPSATALGGGQGGLDRDMIDWFHNHYMQDESLVEDFRVSPLRNPELAGHPDTLLITATDPLRDEGLAYGERLREAGVRLSPGAGPGVLRMKLRLAGLRYGDPVRGKGTGETLRRQIRLQTLGIEGVFRDSGTGELVAVVLTRPRGATSVAERWSEMEDVLDLFARNFAREVVASRARRN